MKQLLKLLLILFLGLLAGVSVLNAQTNITRIEYYVDADPGLGNATALSFTPAANISAQNIALNTSALSIGIHRLVVRAKDANGAWSHNNSYLFLKPFNYSAQSALTNITYLEYYIDTDPGLGSATSVSITPNTNIANQTISLNASALNNGIHKIVVRAKDANGAWSHNNTYLFFKPFGYPSQAALVNIVRLEYFLDNRDPGLGNATAISITPSTNLSNLSVTVQLPCLLAGNHSLDIRAKDANGAWSHVNTYDFTLTTATMATPTTSTQSLIGCGNLVFNNVNYTSSTTVHDTLRTVLGCDSIYNITSIVIKPISTNTISASICSGSSYTVGASTYNSTGTFVTHLTNYVGCDSAVTLNLTVKPNSTNTITASICSGSSYTVGTSNYNTTGTFVTHFTNYVGCDSAVTLHLTVKPNSTNTITTSICSGSSYTVGTSTYNTTGTFVTHFTNYVGCDSAVTLNLTVKPNSTNTITASICSGSSYTVGTSTYNTTGTFLTHLTNYVGCDSAVTLNLSVKPNSTNTITTSICSGSSYTVGTSTYSTTGTFVTHLTNYVGCDSAVTLNLTVKPNSTNSITTSICSGSSYTVGTSTYNTTGTFVTLLTNYVGCDSTVTLNLTVKPNSTNTITTSICSGSSYTVGTSTYSTTGTFVTHLTNYVGCDSTVTLNLTVKPNSTNTITTSICSGSSYTVGTSTYSTTGTFVTLLTNYVGCDSTVTLNLTVKPNSTNTITTSICSGSNYTVGTSTFSTTGTFVTHLTNYVGCDSAVTLNLTVNPNTGSTITQNIVGSSYNFNGTILTANGTYYDTLTNAKGCDSIVTLHLTFVTGINSITIDNTLQVYPNPTDGMLVIKYDGNCNHCKVQLTDMLGKLILTKELNAATKNEIDMGNLSAGSYFILFQNDETKIVRKIVKQ